MKLSNRFAKLTSLQSKAVRTLAVMVLGGAALAAAAPSAQAQQFAVGVRIGGPHQFVPAPAPRFDRYDRYRYEEFRRHEDWRFHHDARDYRGYYR